MKSTTALYLVVGLVMRAAYLPFQSPEQVQEAVAREGRFDAESR